MKYVFVWFWVILMACQHIFAQTDKVERRGLRGVGLGLQLTSRGMGFHMDYLRGTDPNRLFVFSLEMNSVRDSKEALVESVYGEQGRRFVYGKNNHLYVVSPTVGIQRNLFPLHANNQLNLRVSLQAGPAIGLLSPYLVEIFESLPGNNFYGRRSIQQFNPDEHSYDDIIGKANFLSEPLDLQVQVGLNVKASAWIDFSRSKHYLSAVELAIHGNIFPKEVPIMAISQNQQVYLAGALGIVFGNRW